VLIARETLEVVVGERPTAKSFYQAMEVARREYFLTTLPVIGEFVLVYEWMFGREAASGRQLSDSERLIAGLGFMLPHILAHAGKIIAGAAKITRRAIAHCRAEHALVALPTAWVLFICAKTLLVETNAPQAPTPKPLR
jgi:hypothetical protein